MEDEFIEGVPSVTIELVKPIPRFGSIEADEKIREIAEQMAATTGIPLLDAIDAINSCIRPVSIGFHALGDSARRMAASTDDLRHVLLQLQTRVGEAPEPPQKPVQKNRYAFLDGLTRKGHRHQNQKFNNIKGR